MARREMMGLLMVMGLLLAMVPDTMQRAVNLPVQAKIKPLLVGLILSTTSDETLLLESGDYVPKYTTKKAGRTFNVGSFHGVPVVYVIAVAPLAHVSATVQILLDSFKVVGLIDYSNSATVNPSLKLGDVAVLSETAFTSTWTWEDYKSMVNSVQATELPTLKIGEYNVPEAGDNKLGSIEFVNGKKYTPKGVKDNFWYYIDPTWLKIAENLKGLELESCINGLCAEEVPSVVYGVRGSSSDVYLENEAYGMFLNEKLGVSTVDRKSAATVATAVANGVKHIVFRGASNRPGMPQDSNIKALASKNSLKVVSEFIKLLHLTSQNQTPLAEYY